MKYRKQRISSKRNCKKGVYEKVFKISREQSLNFRNVEIGNSVYLLTHLHYYGSYLIQNWANVQDVHILDILDSSNEIEIF